MGPMGLRRPGQAKERERHSTVQSIGVFESDSVWDGLCIAHATTGIRSKHGFRMAFASAKQDKENLWLLDLYCKPLGV
jgi:hypothetical protein